MKELHTPYSILWSPQVRNCEGKIGKVPKYSEKSGKILARLVGVKKEEKKKKKTRSLLKSVRACDRIAPENITH